MPLGGEPLLEVLEEDHVGRRADQRGNAADGRGEARMKEGAKPDAIPRKMDLANPATFFLPKRVSNDSTRALQVFTIITAAATRNRHDSGPTRVTDENGEESRNQHDSKQHGAGLGEELHDGQCNAHVEVPLLHSQRHQEAGKEQEDD